MGKAGRLACIFVPMALTLASLICIILVGLGGTNKHSSTLNGLYFFKADTANITVDSSDLLSARDLASEITNATDGILNLKDFYTVSLWNYCDGTEANSTSKDTVDYCSPRKAQYWFNPLEVWGLNSTSEEQAAVPKSLKDGLKTYKVVAKWMFIAYIIAFVATLVELVVGCFAIFSRWGSFITTLVSTVSSIFTLAASITATALYGTLTGTFNHALKKYGVKASMGKSMYVTTWLAVAFSCGAGLFWLISVCCCSGRSNDKRVKAEKTPYTYERVESPLVGHNVNQAGSSMPMRNMDQRAVSYEPYRHEGV